MPHIFKNIRRKLSAQKKIAEYLRYAFGEIILVMIGILLALQVNNWNQHRKNDAARKAYTRSLISDLQVGATNLKHEIQKLQDGIARMDTLKHRLSTAKANVDTLNHLIRFSFNPTFVAPYPLPQNTYLTLTSTGDISFFKPAIANQIRQYYQFVKNVQNGGDAQIRFYQNMFSKYLATAPFLDVNGFSVTIKNTLWKDVNMKQTQLLFNGIFALRYFNFGQFLKQSKFLLEKDQKLMQVLKKSL